MLNIKTEKIDITNLDQINVLYTDTIFLNANSDGVTFDICQKIPNTNRANVVARIGMSRTHANKFAKKLGEILALTMEKKGNRN